MTPRSSEQGAALLTVLLIVAVMAVMATVALEKLRVATRIASNGGSIDQARAYAFAAESVARYRIGDLLQRDGARTTLDGNWAGQATNLPIDGGLATARLDDGGNCFNLNSLVDAGPDGTLIARPLATAQLARLLTLVEVPGRDANTIAAAATDWIDSDGEPVPGGAEDLAYANASPARRTANTLMADRSELRAVAGVTPAIYDRIAPLVCALPVTDLTAINVNTLAPAQAPLLAMLLPRLDANRVGGAIALRPQHGFASLTDFWNLPPLAGSVGTDDARNQVKLATRWFELSLTVELAGAELEEHALIDAAMKPAKLVRRSYGERG